MTSLKPLSLLSSTRLLELLRLIAIANMIANGVRIADVNEWVVSPFSHFDFREHSPLIGFTFTDSVALRPRSNYTFIGRIIIVILPFREGK